MAFDPSSAREEFDTGSATIVAPAVEVGKETPVTKFKPESARLGFIPFDNLIQIESGGSQFNRVTNKPLISKAGAVGIAQIMPKTGPEAAKLAGVAWDKNKFYNDAAYNRQLGEAYFNNLVDMFDGDSYKAAAAYNAGPTKVKNIIDTFGDDWIKHLPDETQNYVAKLGYAAIENQPEAQATDFQLAEQPMVDYNEALRSGSLGAAAMSILSAIPQAKGVVGAVRGGMAVGPAIARGMSVGDIAAAGAKGFAEGVVGDIAGQAYQYGKPENAQTDLERMGVEFATGAITPSAAGIAVTATKKVASVLPDFLEQAVTKPLSILKGESELSKNIAANAFGRVKIKPGTATTVFTDGMVKLQRKELADSFGLTVPTGMYPSDFVRSKMYNEIRDLGTQGITFKDSPQFTQLMAELDLAKMPKSVKDSIRNIVNRQGSSVPEFAASFEKNLLNLTQQAKGDFAQANLPEEVSKLLSRHLDGFLAANTGTPYYSLLKRLEKDKFTAEARDSIPKLISEGFASNSETRKSLQNIRASESGVNDLKIAVTSYLRNLKNDDVVVNNWNGIETMLKETHAMPLEDILRLRKQVNVYRSLPQKAKTSALLLIKDGLVTGLAAEGAKDKTKPTASTITDIFNM